MNDVINSVWILPDSRPDQYPGSWPLEFEERLLTLYGFDYHTDLKDDVVQLFSGGVKHGFKVDLLEDSHPNYKGDAHHLPDEWTDKWKMCVLDPPYTSNWSRVLWGTSELLYSKYIAEAVRIVKPGGVVACFHWAETPVPDNCILQRRIIVVRNYFKKLRICIVFQKR